MTLEPYDPSRLDAVVELSLRAWAPVFRSIEETLGPGVYRAFYGDDWRATQRSAVAAACADKDMHVVVASEDSRTVGFAALKVHAADRMGEIYMIAVDPDFQRRGIAAALTKHALEWFRGVGMSTAMVETGGDAGHEPARKTYESAGFRLWPVARYFKDL